MAVRQYIGARYVPILMGEWNKALSYEALNIVTYKGNSFTSKKPVPQGTEIDNTEYWVNTGNYNAQVNEFINKVNELTTEINEINQSLSNEINQNLSDVNNNLNTKAEFWSGSRTGVTNTNNQNILNRDFSYFTGSGGIYIVTLQTDTNTSDCASSYIVYGSRITILHEGSNKRAPRLIYEERDYGSYKMLLNTEVGAYQVYYCIVKIATF